MNQLGVYNTIISSTEGNRGDLFCLYARGESNKTRIINQLQAKLRQMKDIALAVASNVISLTLLNGGRTVHPGFKNALNLSKK